jgi:hypothetical protein
MVPGMPLARHDDRETSSQRYRNLNQREQEPGQSSTEGPSADAGQTRLDTSPPKLEAATLSGADPVGIVFEREDCILRGIYADRVEATRELLNSGLIEELEERGLFPATAVSTENIPGFGMTLRHERIRPLTLEYEWSTNMFRDAAMALIEINRIARTYGYETKDAHLYNLTFSGMRPIFFDFGSFAKVAHSWAGWSGYDEFVRSAYYPLAICSRNAAS